MQASLLAVEASTNMSKALFARLVCMSPSAFMTGLARVLEVASTCCLPIRTTCIQVGRFCGIQVQESELKSGLLGLQLLRDCLP